jgi:hypothetical protein
MSSAIDAGAFLCRAVPVAGTRQIARPKGPASALARPNRINHAPFSAIDLAQKYAIISSRLLYDCCTQAHSLDVFFADFR